MEVTNTENQTLELQKKVEVFFEDEKINHKYCPVRDIMDRFGDKWSLLAIMKLGSSGKVRFNELKGKIDGISHRMLTVTLRSLERDGLVSREIFAEVPPRVEYELTPLGFDLLKQVWGMAKWASGNMDAIVGARNIYDSRTQ